MRFANKTVIVTGGVSGIGAAIVDRFISEGAKVHVFDIKESKAEVVSHIVDIRDEHAIQQALEKIDKIDVLINCAGIYFQKSIEETSIEDLDKMVDINFKGTFLMCKNAMAKVRQSKGNIINIASCLGLVPELGASLYCSTKAAIIMLTKSLSQEYAYENIRVNCVLPGPMDTPLVQSSFNSQDDMDAYFVRKPFGRIGKPVEVANVVAFLASDEASFVTGGVYAVDGGESASSLYTKKR